MKREFVAVAILVALLVLSIMNVKYMENKTMSLADEIEEAGELYRSGDAEGSAARVQSSMESWLGWESYSHIMLRHSEIDLVTDAYFGLLSEIESEDTVPEASFGALIEKLNDIVNKERVSLGSLL